MTHHHHPRTKTTLAAATALIAAGLLTGCTADPASRAGASPTSWISASIDNPHGDASPRAVPASPSPSRGAELKTVPRSAAPRTTVDRQDVDAVTRAGLTALYSYDTTLDHRPNDTARRAVFWLSPRLAAATEAFQPPSAPGAQWDSWTRHRARTQVTLAPAHDDHPADSSTRAYRQYQVTYTPIGRDAWRGPRETLVAFVTLVHTDGWLIDSVVPR